MRRLTESNPSWINDELWESACEPDCEEIDAVYRKLKDYEDLEERLSKVYGECGGLLESMVELLEKHSGVDIPDDTVKVHLITNESVDFYKKCKSLEEQGRLIKLPCKDVYFIVDINNLKYAMVMKRPIRELAIYEIESIDKENCKYFSTEEKAEAKLKELRCNND